MKLLRLQNRVVCVLVMWTFWSSACGAALIVDPARPITHQVNVQIIETALSDGTSPATVFGNATQRASIESAIDRIWAQAGVDIAFLQHHERYDNTFAYQGNGGSRPTNDLSTIISTATAAGAVNSDSAVINMFFVNIVPGFGYLGENSANGIGSIGNDGIAQFVGDNLLGFASGRDIVASVVAHEIGHNLGLKHAASGEPNLMSPNGTSEQLSEAQIAAIFQTTRRSDSIAFIPSGGTGFVQPLAPSPQLNGDYNDNGLVDAADYVQWRNSAGSSTDLTADGNGNLVVDDGDYTVWRSGFGMAAAVGTLVSTPISASAGIPEPRSTAIIAGGLLIMSLKWRLPGRPRFAEIPGAGSTTTNHMRIR